MFHDDKFSYHDDLLLGVKTTCIYFRNGWVPYRTYPQFLKESSGLANEAPGILFVEFESLFRGERKSFEARFVFGHIATNTKSVCTGARRLNV